MDIQAYEDKRMEFECKKVNFLCEHPHLLMLQHKIDLALNKAGPKQHNRCVIITTMMYEEVGHLIDAVVDLQMLDAELQGLVAEQLQHQASQG